MFDDGCLSLACSIIYWTMSSVDTRAVSETLSESTSEIETREVGMLTEEYRG